MDTTYRIGRGVPGPRLAPPRRSVPGWAAEALWHGRILLLAGLLLAALPPAAPEPAGVPRWTYVGEVR